MRHIILLSKLSKIPGLLFKKGTKKTSKIIIFWCPKGWKIASSGKKILPMRPKITFSLDVKVFRGESKKLPPRKGKKRLER